MEKKIRFAKIMEPVKVEREEGVISITPLLKTIGGKIFKILDEGRDTVTISVDSEPREIDKAFISETLEYDKNGVISALKVLKKVCKCYTTMTGACEHTCPFYDESRNGNCKLLVLPSDWVIVDEEIWRPIR